MPEPGLYIVVWNGVLLEGEWPDAIFFDRAEAEVFVARSPGRKESYAIEPWTQPALAASPTYSGNAEQVRRQLESADRTPIILGPDEWRAQRGR